MAKKHIVVDPITRIEGHLRIEAVIDDNNTIVDAWSSSTLFRGIETILQGRDPRDAGLLAMRICGVCTGTHYQRSIEAVEDAFGVTIPKNARIVRNLIQGALFMHDHTVHFYHLHALDFVDVVSALSADPVKTAKEAEKWANVAGTTAYIGGEGQFKEIKERVAKFVKQGRLGIFGNGYWGNKHYKLTPEQNLIGVAHYLKALDIQREMAKMQAIFGGKNPHPQSIVVGGVTCVQDIENPARIALFKDLLKQSTAFVKQAYLPDVYMAGTMYADEATDSKATFTELMEGKGVGGEGGGLLNYMAYGGFRLDDTGFYKAETLFPSGIVYGGDLSKVEDVDPEKIAEDVTHSWYKGHEKYSWIKSPIYNDTRVEVGPLARMIVGVARKDERITKYVTNFLKRGNLPTSVLFSTVGRTMHEWADELAKNAASGDLSTWTEFDFDKVSVKTKGKGMEEAPRGALGHWVKVEDGKIVNYQAVVPSTWNAAPRDYKGRMGAYEASLIGIKVANPEQPLEIIRTIHSFDPCIACAVHVVNTKGKELGVYKIDTQCSI